MNGPGYESRAMKGNMAKSKLDALRADAKKLQEDGEAAFLEYYENSPYAKAKMAAGMFFTPESVAYMVRENENRRIAKQIYDENTKELTDEAPAPDAPVQHKPDSDTPRDGGGGRGGAETGSGRLDTGEPDQGQSSGQ